MRSLFSLFCTLVSPSLWAIDCKSGKRNMHIKRLATAALVFAVFCTVSGCKNQPSDKDAIRAGILQHLKAVGTLNISAMEMDIRNVSINGNQAHAEVEFRPKTGAAPGTGMQVTYNLEKRE